MEPEPQGSSCVRNGFPCREVLFRDCDAIRMAEKRVTRRPLQFRTPQKNGLAIYTPMR